MASVLARKFSWVAVVVGLVGSAPFAAADPLPLTPIAPDVGLEPSLGIRYGGLIYRPTIATGIINDSNILYSNTNAARDWVFFVRPGLSIATTDPNYRFVLRTDIEHLEYRESDADSRTNATATLDGTVRAARDLEFDVGASARHANDQRTATRRDLPTNLAEPAPHDAYSSRLAMRSFFRPVISTLAVDYATDSYSSVRSVTGSIVDLRFLDRDMLTVSHKTEVPFSQRFRFVNRVAWIETDYRNVPLVVPRDSSKVEVSNGVEVVFSPVLRGDFTFLYGKSDFTSPLIVADPENFYTLNLIWQPRSYFTLRFNAAREFGGVNFEQDFGAGRRTRLGVTMDYGITRRLTWRAGFNYVHANGDNLLGATRVEDQYVYNTSLGYAVNDRVSLFLDYNLENYNSTISAEQYDRQVIQAGVIARY